MVCQVLSVLLFFGLFVWFFPNCENIPAVHYTKPKIQFLQLRFCCALLPSSVISYPSACSTPAAPHTNHTSQINIQNKTPKPMSSTCPSQNKKNKLLFLA